MPTRPGNPLHGGERVLDSLPRTAPGLLLLTAPVLAAAFLGRRRIATGVQAGLDPALLTLVGMIGLWIVLFAHNLPLLPRVIGFDAEDHLQYIDHLMKTRTLPSGSEGPEMHQPPLYYLLSAGLLALAGLTTGHPLGVNLLRVFSLAATLAQFVFILRILRRLFPGQTQPQIAGLVLAGFLPALLALTHYPTNETWAALFVTVSIDLALQARQTDNPSPRRLAALGAMLGMALLTKVTSLLAVPVILVTLAWPRTGQRLAWRTALRQASIPLLACVLASGWHFAPRWFRAGGPLSGNLDFSYGTRWWQQDGFRTGDFYLRLHDGLAAPLFSGSRSYPAGLYSTLWGDGLCGGVAALEFRPPWNYDLMNSAYAFALLPTALLAIGLLVALGRFLHRPGAERFLVLALIGAMGFAMLYMSLRVPSSALVKAFHGLVALGPFCVLGALGWDWLARRAAWVGWMLALPAVVWAASSFGSFWIRGGTAAPHTLMGHGTVQDGRLREAGSHFAKALELDPGHVHARSALAALQARLGRLAEATKLAGENLRLHPDSAICHLDMASAFESNADLEKAVEHTRRALELAPDHPRAHPHLASRLLQLRRPAEAVQACRAGLRLKPASPELHLLLATALTDGGAATTPRAVRDEALRHLELVLQSAPNHPDALRARARLMEGNSPRD